MAFSEEQLKDYGLIPSDKNANPEKGLVADAQGNVYQIEGFDRQQKDGLDTDQGDVFDSSLYADAQAADSDYDPTNFNTGTDVQNALQVISRSFAPYEEEEETQAPYEPSEEIAQATNNIDQYEADILSGATSERIFGDTAGKKKAAQNYMASLNQQTGPTRDQLFDKYYLNISKDMKPSVQSMLNAELAVTNAPFKRSDGRDPQTQPLSDSWVFNNWKNYATTLNYVNSLTP